MIKNQRIRLKFEGVYEKNAVDGFRSVIIFLLLQFNIL